jgi:ABC-type polysaccharide/polyol phosphate export permease
MAENAVYDSARRIHPALEELREIINYRDLIVQLVRRDVLTRYKRSVLGIAWTLLNPLGMMLVLTLAFSQILRFNTVYGYAAFVLSGLIAWNFFGQSTTAAMVNLVWGGGLLSRIYIPRASFALAAIGTAMVNILLALIPLLAVNLITGVPITPAFLFVPVPLLLLACFSLGLGLLLSTSAVYFPDIAEMYQIILSAWFYLTPIIYPVQALPEPLQYWIRFNPMYQLLELFRLAVYYGRFPTWEQLWPSLLIASVTLVLGWVIFSRKSNEFGYRI